MMSITLPAAWQDRPWLEQSWQRCIAQGRTPEEAIVFNSVPQGVIRRSHETHHALLEAAQGVIDKLGAAIASTRYFVMLTDAQGIVIRTGGWIDPHDRRATSIARVGVDLSEPSIGTSAIGTALHEKKAVWLHRSEHFFKATSIYSCAGAPLFAPDGSCVGMLDITGVDTQARPELMHLVAQSAHTIENTMVHQLPYALMLRLNWSGMELGQASDGLVALDRDGRLLGFNQAAYHMLGMNPLGHASDLFAFGFEHFFDAAQRGKLCLDVPLWSGLRLHVQPLGPHHTTRQYPASGFIPNATTAPSSAFSAASILTMVDQLPIKDVTSQLIQQAIRETKGNVAQAARKLGISRATLYRKLAPKHKPHG